MKKKIKIYIAALQSPGSFGVYTLDNVYCFPTKKERDEWRRQIDNEIGDVTYFDKEMEVEGL